MPRFSVAFGRRKSTADNLDNDVTAEPSFRVLDRSEVAPGKSFDGGASFAAKPHTYAKHSVSDIKVEDNLFADLKPQTNRGSGSSNTTKTISTDTSSRHSNVSTAASSADFSNHNDDQKIPHRKPVGDGPGHSGHKSTPSGFLKAAGRSFSFGGQKKPLPIVPNLDEPLPPPPVPPHSEDFGGVGRARAATSSTSTTVTPPKLDADFSLDLGGDFAKMFGFDKRASVMTVRGNEPNGRQSLGPRSLTGNRLNQSGPIPAPIQINKSAKVDAPPHSWGSQHSNEGLLTQSPAQASPINENAPTAVPRQPSPLSGRPLRPITSPETRKLSGFFGKRASPTEETEDEDAKLLKDSLSTVSKFMAGSSATTAVPKPKPGSRYRRDEDTLAKSEAKLTELELDDIGDDNLFDNSLAHSSRLANRFVARKPSPPRTKVMTPAQFERYRQDKERQSAAPDAEKPEDKSDDEEIDYDDDEDDIERAKQQAKQRRKQEAHMAVYRQQMMKVTGESSGGAPPSRPSLQMSFSTPNLPNMVDPSPAGKSDSDEDEEVPLAILAAHGFPNKARPPTRLSSMMSNPNLRASVQPSYQRPGSAAGDAPGGGNGRLPAFARKLPQDPFLGAGLVHNPVRESIAFSGGAPARGHPGPVPPGGLVGVIVNEERSRAMRRGSPHVDPHQPAAYDPIGGIPPHMLYQNNRASTMMTPGDQAQIQMTQQMQQFMQMQMQFMQMMAGQNGNAGVGPNGMPMGMNPNGANAAAMNNMMAMAGMGGPDMRHSYMGNGSVVDLPQRPESHSRSMSMVQPSSASWIQPPPRLNPGFAPSIHIQGVGYAPSIAPSERSNIGLPGRYRPVSHMPPAVGQEIPRSSTMSGALAAWDKQPSPTVSVTPVPAGRKSGSGNASEDDDEEGWQAMKEKREKKRSMWKSKKGFGADIGALIN